MPERKIVRIIGYIRVDYAAVLGGLAGIVKRTCGDDAMEIKFEIHQLPDGAIMVDCPMPGDRECYEDGTLKMTDERRLFRDAWGRIMAQFTDVKTAVDTTNNGAYRFAVAMRSLEQVRGYLGKNTEHLRLEIEYENGEAAA